MDFSLHELTFNISVAFSSSNFLWSKYEICIRSTFWVLILVFPLSIQIHDHGPLSLKIQNTK